MAAARESLRRHGRVPVGASAAARLWQGPRLQDCGSVSKASGERKEVYPKLQVNGRTGFSGAQVARAGVWLCARHSARLETYKGEEACSEPEEVFRDGELPDIMVGDVQALLLVRCPSASYPGGQIMARVTCAKDYWFDNPDGPVQEELSIHFDGRREAVNCKTNVTGWEDYAADFEAASPEKRNEVKPVAEIRPHSLPSSLETLRRAGTEQPTKKQQEVMILEATVDAAAYEPKVVKLPARKRKTG